MQVNENLNMSIEKNQSKLMIENADLNKLENENEVMSNALINKKISLTVREMQNDDLMILPTLLISILKLRN